jgi:hypothetical protein
VQDYADQRATLGVTAKDRSGSQDECTNHLYYFALISCTPNASYIINSKILSNGGKNFLNGTCYFSIHNSYLFS